MEGADSCCPESSVCPVLFGSHTSKKNHFYICFDFVAEDQGPPVKLPNVFCKWLPRAEGLTKGLEALTKVTFSLCLWLSLLLCKTRAVDGLASKGSFNFNISVFLFLEVWERIKDLPPPLTSEQLCQKTERSLCFSAFR